MIQASLYGRMGRDPQTRQTKSGATMTTTSIAVDATPGNHDGDQETVWFQVLAFGKVADTLTRHSDGSSPISQTESASQPIEYFKQNSFPSAEPVCLHFRGLLHCSTWGMGIESVKQGFLFLIWTG